jgi:4-hydroxythreonine-4-phosphate dehydrogenase
VRARAGEFDAVLTMYHDQGQIAMKLIGFFEGVVYFAGLPFPLTTPAHGTAYEIVGQGKADIRANRAAILLAGKMVN